MISITTGLLLVQLFHQVELVVDGDVERDAASPGPEKRAGRFAGRGRREPRRDGGASSAPAEVVGEQADAD